MALYSTYLVWFFTAAQRAGVDRDPARDGDLVRRRRADRAGRHPAGRAGVAARARDRDDRHVPRDQLDRAGAVRQRHQAAAARVPEQDLAARATCRSRATRSCSSACSLVECLLLYLLLQRTRIGLAFRAVASNPESSRLLGVPVGRDADAGLGDGRRDRRARGCARRRAASACRARACRRSSCSRSRPPRSAASTVRSARSSAG